MTLKSGDVFAVDLTGAQYGYFDPVCAWSECLQERLLDEEALRIGFHEDEHVVPLMAAEPDISGFAQPNVDSYYALVMEVFSKSMASYLGNLSSIASAMPEMQQGLPESRKLMAEVRKQALSATLAADMVWDTHPWQRILQERLEADEKERLQAFRGTHESLL